MRPVVNIGMVGHVDHGKTMLVSALTGIWTDRHSEEIKRGISIRLGYADVTFRKCSKCKPPDGYTVERKCPVCRKPTKELRTVSFVDSPGHETLMATMLSGAAIMEGAILVIAANEPCPQPQTKEHLIALDVIGIKNIVIAQNKIDLVGRSEALQNYRQIKEFVKGTIAENAPVVPVSAVQKANIDLLIQKIEESIPTPKHDFATAPRMLIARSFDVNRPGILPDKLQGGVIGGALSQGKLKVKDKIEIRPGRKVEIGGESKWVPVSSEIVSIKIGDRFVNEATPGGLVGIGTKLDPSMTKGDELAGQVAGIPGKLPPVLEKFDLEVRLLEKVVGTAKELEVEPIKLNEILMLSSGTATTIATVTSMKKDRISVNLRRPICASPGSRVAISRRFGARWHLIGFGTLG